MGIKRAGRGDGQNIIGMVVVHPGPPLPGTAIASFYHNVWSQSFCRSSQGEHRGRVVETCVSVSEVTDSIPRITGEFVPKDGLRSLRQAGHKLLNCSIDLTCWIWLHVKSRYFSHCCYTKYKNANYS